MFHISGFADELDRDFEKQMSIWHDMGLKYFELRSAWGINVMQLSDEQIQKIKDISSSYGIKVSCIGSPIGKTYIEDDFSYELNRLDRAIFLAKYFGCSFIRVFSFYSKENILDKREEVFKRLSKMAEIARESHIILLHENEHAIYGELSLQSREIAKELNSPNFGLVFDPANYSVAGEDVIVAEKNMHDYITYIHVKDYSIKEKVMKVPGEGDSNIKYVFQQHRDKDMFISMEPHLDVAGQFGGSTAPEKYKMAVDSVKNMLNELSIEWE